jgi:hypothetical protein
MSLYPKTVQRCQQIKVNGTQCGSPALRDSKYCYYHIRYHWQELEALPDNNEWRTPMPTLEDANSIQVSLASVMERLTMQEIDHRTAALLLYALQTASMNLKRTSLEPDLPTQVVIDRESVAQRPIGATAWSKVEGREYDEEGEEDTREDDARKADAIAEEWDPDRNCPKKWDFLFKFLIDREIARDPESADRTLGTLRGLRLKESVEG